MFLLLMLDCLRQALGQRESQGNGMFSHNRPVNVARVGDDDVAGPQLGRHELMHRGGSGMDPAQLFGGFDLFSPQRPRNRDVGGGNFFSHAIVVGKVYDFELGKLAAQPFGKPCRHLPQFETVIEGNEELHGAYCDRGIIYWSSWLIWNPACFDALRVFSVSIGECCS